MCFRPSIAETSVNCPGCGKRINAVMGTVPNVCPFCEADLEGLTRGINEGVLGAAPSAAPPFASGPAALPAGPDALKAPGSPKPPVNWNGGDQQSRQSGP